MSRSDGRRTGRRSGAGRFEVIATTTAPPTAVWDLVGVAGEWRKWSWMTRTGLLSPGAPEPEGVGALRHFAVGPVGSVEEVVAWEPPYHLGYVARRGLPVRSYRADVRLEPASIGPGTRVCWTGSVDPLVPGTRAVICAVVRAIVAGFARRLCRYADEIAGTPRGADPEELAPVRTRARREEDGERW